MTKRIPDYLKLHTEDEAGACQSSVPDIRSLASLQRAFAEATGWQLSCNATDDAPPSQWTMTVDSTAPPAAPSIAPSATRLDTKPGWERAAALAEAIGDLVQELLETRDALCRREAELATSIPVTLRDDDSQQLARHLESILRGGAEALECHAAALYLLDDTTSYLKIRACWGLPKDRLTRPARPLRGAVSDLEALVGHAVALEDVAVLPHWKAPEDFPAALCVPVSSSNTPLGTLWFFCRERREFTDQQTHLAEIIAGRLVADIEREVIASEHLRARHGKEALHIVSRFQDELAPRIPPLIDGWQVAGRAARTATVDGNYYDWLVLPDGRLAVIVGRAEGESVEAALTASLLLVAFRAHATHRHNARQMLDYLNESLWTGSTGDRFASAWYGLIDPEQGTMQYATAGRITAAVAAPDSLRSCAGKNDQPPLGADPDHYYSTASDELQAGASLILCSSATEAARASLDTLRASRPANAKIARTAEEQLDTLWPTLTTDGDAGQSVVVVRHIY